MGDVAVCNSTGSESGCQIGSCKRDTGYCGPRALLCNVFPGLLGGVEVELGWWGVPGNINILLVIFKWSRFGKERRRKFNLRLKK